MPSDSAIREKIPRHYSCMPIDVVEFCMANGLSFMQGNVIKYICRYKRKNGINDLRKARAYIDRLIAFELEKRHRRRQGGI